MSGARPVDAGDANTEALRAFDTAVLGDPRFVATILPIGDGLLIALVARLTADGAELMTIAVRVRLFAIQRELAGTREVTVELADGADVEAAWTALASRFPVLAPGRPVAALRPERRLRRARRRRWRRRRGGA